MMSLLRGMAAGTIVLLLGIGSAQAMLVTDTFESTITADTSSTFSVGDVFQWAVTYDDAGVVFHFYNDGPDGLAQTSDDFVSNTVQIANYTGYTYFTDAQYDLSSIYDPLLAAGYAGSDIYSSNDSFTYAGTSTDYNKMHDDYSFDSNGGAIGSFTTGYLDQYDNQVRQQINFTSILVGRQSVQKATVPEPGSLVLLGIGMIGLGVNRKRKR